MIKRGTCYADVWGAKGLVLRQVTLTFPWPVSVGQRVCFSQFSGLAAFSLQEQADPWFVIVDLSWFYDDDRCIPLLQLWHVASLPTDESRPDRIPAAEPQVEAEPTDCPAPGESIPPGPQNSQ